MAVLRKCNKAKTLFYYFKCIVHTCDLLGAIFMSMKDYSKNDIDFRTG